MTDEPADGQQVSVAELLARNGQRVGAAGGRRRRGVAGGISVAELTGEIPVVQDEPRAETEQPEPPRAEPPRAEPPRAEPPRAEPPRAEPPRAEPQRAEPPRPEPVAPVAAVAETKRPEPARPEVKRTPTKAQVKAPVWPTDGDTPDRPSKSTMDTTRTFAMAEIEADEDASADAAETALIPKVVERTPPKSTKTVAAPAIDDAPDTDAHEVVEAPVEPGVDHSAEHVDEAAVDEAAVDNQATDEHVTDDPDSEEPAPPAATGKRSPLRQWAGIVGQGLVAIVLGALLFKGFERLWDVLPWVALVLSFFVIVGLVAVVRVLRRTDDIVSILLAVLVGGFVTLGPLAFILSTN
ncbi:hypothetical protein GCM10007304_07020 [Rhodococcoides trifolii]|uniref:Uncharacterized protein n=1 Tax=Rhodococcoides trifolii TaxID=908250 RepID=A0A917CQ51_9NOCA|nr:Yip1 family protein [Rhodococcus trifolii]GGF95766.1 hypothetical protein GCM10007304_07020 [Rhodococcus trifolii]